MSLAQQRVLILGGTSGFGLQVAHQAIAAGAEVTIVGRHADRLMKAQQTIIAAQPESILETAQFNASDVKLLTAFFKTNERFDHVVSMLGGAMSGGFLANSVADIRAAIEAKFFDNLKIAQVASRDLNPGGSLTFTSGSGGSPATASGAIVGNQAINLMVQGLAVELAPDKRVNAVSPTWTPTGLWRKLTDDEIADQTNAFAANVPLKRVAKPAEVASAYLYLMQNQFVTGQVLAVDGGVDLD